MKSKPKKSAGGRKRVESFKGVRDNKRSVMRFFRNKNRFSRFLTVISEDIAKDRSRYYDGFLGAWELAERALSGAVAALKEGGKVALGESVREDMSRPYGVMFFLVYGRLADDMTMDEEALFRSCVSRLAGAWGEFAALASVRRRKLSGVAESVREDALALNAAVSSVFLGESPTAYAPGLHERHVRLTAALAALAEGLAR